MVFSAGLEATALRQAGCPPLQRWPCAWWLSAKTGRRPRPGQWQFGVDERGQRAFEFLSCKGGEVAKAMR